MKRRVFTAVAAVLLAALFILSCACAPVQNGDSGNGGNGQQELPGGDSGNEPGNEPGDEPGEEPGDQPGEEEPGEDPKPTVHQPEAVPYKAPTCSENGNIAYWACAHCDKYYADAEESVEIAFDETLIEADADAHAYDSSDVCTDCGAAYTFTNGLTYTLAEDRQSYAVTGPGTVTEGDVKIARHIEGLPVTEVGEKAFEGCTGFTSLYIPDTVTAIATDAFDGCTGLKSIVISDNVTDLSYGVLADCTALESITLPFVGERDNADTVQEMQPQFGLLFGAGTWQQNINYVPASLTGVTVTRESTVSDHAFAGCEHIVNVTLPAGTTKIGNNAFSGCTSLQNITLGKILLEIGAYAFGGCSAGYQSFDGCAALELADPALPVHLNTLGEGAFEECESISEISLHAGITQIPDNVFQSCSGLLKVRFGGNVTEIGASAFNGCSALADIEFPETLTDIGDTAFLLCTALEAISLPDSLRHIGFHAFYMTGYYSTGANWSLGATGKGALYIGKHLIELERNYSSPGFIVKDGTLCIADCALEYSASDGGKFTTVSLPASIRAIGADAFDGRSAISQLTIKDLAGWCTVQLANEKSNPMYYADTMRLTGEGEIRKLTVPEGVTEIAPYTFYNVTRLTGAELPSTVTSVGEYAFAKSFSIATKGSIDLGGARTIAAHAFEGAGMGTVSFGSVESIGEYAFSGCDALAAVSLPASTEQIGLRAFAGCPQLAEITVAKGNPVYTAEGNCLLEGDVLVAGCKDSVIPSSVKEIGAYAFSSITSMAEIIIPEGVERIGDWAFYNCNFLSAVALPASVAEVGERAFYNCTALTAVTINGTPLIHPFAFTGCTKLAEANFAVTEGWFRTQDPDASEGTAVPAADLADPAKAAQLLWDGNNGNAYWKNA